MTFCVRLLIVLWGVFACRELHAAPIEVANAHAYVNSTYHTPNYGFHLPSNRVWLEVPYTYQMDDEYNLRGGVERVAVEGLRLEGATGEIFWGSVACARVVSNLVVPTGRCDFSSEVREVLFDDGVSVRPRLRLFIYLDLR